MPKNTLNNKKRLHRFGGAELALPAIIVTVIMLIIYAINGVFPFGDESVVYYDFVQTGTPMFYNFWDMLHGKADLFFTWNTATGIYNTSPLVMLCSPLKCLFFLICPRDRILDSMSFYVLMYIVLAAFTSMLFFTKKFKISVAWRTVFSVLYAFCPYSLQYYTNVSWLEIVAMMPIVLLCLDRLFEKGKILPYTIIMAYCVMTHYYLSFMIYIYLFLVGGLYILMHIQKEKRTESIIKFGVSSALSVGLSAFVLLPVYLNLKECSRFQTAESRSYMQIALSTAANSTYKLGMVILLMALPIVLMCFMLLNYKKDKKGVAFFTLACAVCVIPAFFENINLFWHFGSYINFPMRFAFLISITVLTACCYTVERFGDRLSTGKRKLPFVMTAAALLSAAAGALLMINKVYEKESDYKLISADNMYILIAVLALFMVAYALLFIFGKKRMSCVIMCALVLFETGFYANRAFSTGRTRVYEYSLDYIEDSVEIYNDLTIENDSISRIKNIDTSLNTNYPLIIDYPAVSNFTHAIPSTLKKTLAKMGYSTVYTRLLDTGGTLLTDALLGCKYILSADEINDDAYTFVEMAGDYYIYSCNYTLPFANVCSGEILGNTSVSSTVFANNNSIAKALTSSDEDFFETPVISTAEDENSITYSFSVRGEKRLYLYATGMKKRHSVRIYLNGKAVSVPSINNRTNTTYTMTFNNNVLDLGTFSNEIVTVKIDILNSSSVTPDTLRTNISLLDMEKFKQLCESKTDTTTAVAGDRSLYVTAYSKTGEDYLFLPVAQSDGWSCTVNGKPARISTALNTFMAVKLEKGENQINMMFTPVGLKKGVAISLISLVLLIAALLLFKKRQMRFKEKSVFASTVNIAYFLSVVVAYGVLYVFPMLCRFYTLITK